MSKLGEILEKLREKKIDKTSSRNIFEHQIEEYSYQRKKKYSSSNIANHSLF